MAEQRTTLEAIGGRPVVRGITARLMASVVYDAHPDNISSWFDQIAEQGRLDQHAGYVGNALMQLWGGAVDRDQLVGVLREKHAGVEPITEPQLQRFIGHAVAAVTTEVYQEEAAAQAVGELAALEDDLRDMFVRPAVT